MRTSKLRRFVAGAAATAIGLLTLPGLTGTAAAGAIRLTPDTADAAGEAHGGTGLITVAGVEVAVGRIATEHIPCNATPDKIYENKVLSTEFGLPPDNPIVVALATGTVVNQGVVHREPGLLDVTENSTIQSVNLLDGLISAEVIEARAQVTFDAAGVNKHTSVDDFTGGDDGGTGFSVLNLSIAGQVFNGEIPPNTTIDLDGLGKVVLNEQFMIGSVVKPPKQKAGISVNGIHVILGDPANPTVDLVLAHAQVKLKQANIALSGHAYAAKVSVNPIAETGKIGRLAIGCDGTDGVTETESILSIDVPTLLSTGTGTATVMGDLATKHSHSTETIQGVNILNGTVTADVLKVTADTIAGPTGIVSTGSTEVVNLKLPGLDPITATLGPNTTITLDGLGIIRLNWQQCRANTGTPAASNSCTGITYDEITVTALHVVILDEGNSLGLPVGAVIDVAVAHSDVRLGTVS